MKAKAALDPAQLCYARLCRAVEATERARPELTSGEIATAIGALVASVISHSRLIQPERMTAADTAALTHNMLSIISDFAIESITREVSEEQADIMAAQALESGGALETADRILSALGVGLAKKDGV